jgi:hypothetical protein
MSYVMDTDGENYIVAKLSQTPSSSFSLFPFDPATPLSQPPVKVDLAAQFQPILTLLDS